MPPLMVPSTRQKRKLSPSPKLRARGATTRRSRQKKKVISSLSSSDVSDDESNDEYINENGADDKSDEEVEKVAEDSENRKELATPKPPGNQGPEECSSRCIVGTGRHDEPSPNSKELRSQSRYVTGMQ